MVNLNQILLGDDNRLCSASVLIECSHTPEVSLTALGVFRGSPLDNELEVVAIVNETSDSTS